MTINKWMLSVCTGALFSIAAGPVFADSGQCSGLPGWQALRNALLKVVAAAGNGGLGFNMWGTNRRQRRDRLLGGLFGLDIHQSMAGQPGHLSAKGEHGE